MRFWKNWMVDSCQSFEEKCADTFEAVRGALGGTLLFL